MVKSVNVSTSKLEKDFAGLRLRNTQAEAIRILAKENNMSCAGVKYRLGLVYRNEQV